MSEKIYFDCFTYIGKFTPKDEWQLYNREHLLSEMKRCGISYALVVHTLARDYDPIIGNKILLDEIKKHPQLIPCFVLMPDITGEFPDVNFYLRDNNVRAVKLYPKLHRYFFDEYTCGKIFKSLEENEIPLFIEAGRGFDEKFNQATLDEIDTLCSNHKNLYVVLQGVRWEETRKIFTMMKKHTNLYIEFSSFQINRGIEYIVENFGADRILFGSEFPLKSIGSARTFLEYSEINDEDKIKIAGINLAKLLKMKLYNFETTSDDELIESAKKGEEIKIQIYDAHAHLGDENEITSGYTPLIKSAIDQIFQLNKKIGIKKCCVSSWLSIWSDHRLGNEITLKAIEKYPEHFIGYASFNPVYVEDWDDELNYWFVVKNFKGIKPYYPRTLIPYNDKRWGKLFEFGNKLKLFALLHPSDNFVDEVNEISLLYPEVNFLLAHTGIGFKHAMDLIDIVKERKNVFFELTFTNVPDGLIEFLVNEVGSDKIIFGTDQPMRDPRPQLGWVIYSRIPVQDKIKILGFNMEKIIKNCSLKTNLEKVK
jgi:predicted TIM-barrel fold metal-dependent hydrolase